MCKSEHMTEPRLKTSIWVAALIRRYDMEGVPVAVARRGDADSGAVILKMNRREAGCLALVQARIAAGELVWMRATGETPVPESECDAYVAKAVSRDPDLWVVEIEDRQGRQFFEGRVV
jgi:hypothetical protein